MSQNPVWRDDLRNNKPPIGSVWVLVRTSGNFGVESRKDNEAVAVGETAIVVSHYVPRWDHCVELMLCKDGKRMSFGPGWFGHSRAAWKRVRRKLTDEEKLLCVRGIVKDVVS